MLSGDAAGGGAEAVHIARFAICVRVCAVALIVRGVRWRVVVVVCLVFGAPCVSPARFVVVVLCCLSVSLLVDVAQLVGGCL